MGKNRDMEISREKSESIISSKNAYTLEKLGMYCVSGISKTRFEGVRYTLLEHARKTRVDIFFAEYYEHAGMLDNQHIWKIKPDYIGVYVKTDWDMFRWKQEYLKLPYI
ncbi:hypothetical protein [Catenovulum agarivorans]|uniref:hypothetical protein n=1 Tax=Catenovulum agarivorans TaxID=1172192 RepID=UPI0003623DCA|nr:hypothetical protein [Catenovulum agarivorans]